MPTTPCLLQSVLKPRNASRRSVISPNFPNRNRRVSSPPGAAPQICLCSPTTHPGSFRCHLHRASPHENSLLLRASGFASPAVAKASPKQAPLIGGSNTRMKVESVEGGGRRRAVTSSVDTSDYLTFPRKMSSEARPSRLSRVVMAGESEESVFASAGSVLCHKMDSMMKLSRKMELLM